jgi:hypothetical protein
MAKKRLFLAALGRKTKSVAAQMLLLRTYYKSKHWQVLTHKAFATPLANAA